VFDWGLAKPAVCRRSADETSAENYNLQKHTRDLSFDPMPHSPAAAVKGRLASAAAAVAARCCRLKKVFA
jgi:hypothetical protein